MFSIFADIPTPRSALEAGLFLTIRSARFTAMVDFRPHHKPGARNLPYAPAGRTVAAPLPNNSHRDRQPALVYSEPQLSGQWEVFSVLASDFDAVFASGAR